MGGYELLAQMASSCSTVLRSPGYGAYLQGIYQQGMQQAQFQHGQVTNPAPGGQWVAEGSALPKGAIRLGVRDFNRAAEKIARNEQEWLDHRVDEMRVKL